LSLSWWIAVSILMKYNLSTFSFVAFALSGIHQKYSCWALMAHTCNSSYSGGRDQEDHSSRPIVGQTDPSLKIPNTKKGW
jgi:hypothetical protein